MSKIKDIQNILLSITEADLASISGSRKPIHVVPIEKAKSRQLNNAISACKAAKDSQKIAIILDNTMFASGKDSIIFTEDGIYTSSGYYSAKGEPKIPMPILYEELESVNLLEEKKAV